jgi:hypothetical protein
MDCRMNTNMDVKQTGMDFNAKKLIRAIFELQKKIIITRRLMRDMAVDGMDDTVQREEIAEAEKEISKFQKELRKKYQFYY